MRCTVHFYMLNYDFSPEFAEAHHGGEESENNRKYDWEDELEITSDIVDVEVIKGATYTLRGEKKDGAFAEEIPNMILFHFKNKNGNSTEMACSKILVKDFTIEKSEERIVCKVYLEENEPLSNPIPGIYIGAKDFPKSLIE